MAYLKCFGVGVLMALAGAFAWLVYMLFRESGSGTATSGAVSIDVRGLFDNRSLLVVLIFFVVGFFIEFLILKRGLLHPR